MLLQKKIIKLSTNANEIQGKIAGKVEIYLRRRLQDEGEIKLNYT